MSAVALLDELSAALAAVSPDQDRHLLALGIPDDTRRICGAVRAGVDGNLFQPDPAGVPLVIVPAWCDGAIIDAVGFQTATPSQWWLRTGLADYLGSDAIEARWHDELIDVYRSPLSWLIAGAPRDGLVILNPNPPRVDFAGVELVAEDEDHAGELLEMLTIPARAEWRPTVRLPTRAAA